MFYSGSVDNFLLLSWYKFGVITGKDMLTKLLERLETRIQQKSKDRRDAKTINFTRCHKFQRNVKVINLNLNRPRSFNYGCGVIKLLHIPISFDTYINIGNDI